MPFLPVQTSQVRGQSGNFACATLQAIEVFTALCQFPKGVDYFPPPNDLARRFVALEKVKYKAGGWVNLVVHRAREAGKEEADLGGYEMIENQLYLSLQLEMARDSQFTFAHKFQEVEEALTERWWDGRIAGRQDRTVHYRANA